MTIDDLQPGNRIRFHDTSVGADYEGVFVKRTPPTIRDGAGILCRDWAVVSIFGRLVTQPVMTMDGLWHVKNLSDLTRLDS